MHKQLEHQIKRIITCKHLNELPVYDRTEDWEVKIIIGNVTIYLEHDEFGKIQNYTVFI